MGRNVKLLTQSNFVDIPYPCRSCIHWSPADKLTCEFPGDSAEEIKKNLINQISREWGNCGFLLYDEKAVVGYGLYGPPEYFPKSNDYIAGPVGSDAIFLACIFIVADARRLGGGQQLLIAIEKQMHKQKFKAIELFASKTDDTVPGNPIDYYLNRGFYIKKDDLQFPLLRMDMKSLAAWQSNVEAAIKSLSRPLKKRQIPNKAPVPL